MMLRHLYLTFLMLFASGFLWGETPGPFPDWVKVELNIAYDKYPQTKLDLFQPTAPSARRRPGVINIHGGGWLGPASEKIFDRMCLPYLEKGFVVINIDYRLAGGAGGAAAVDGGSAAARWVRRNA